jgi:hypothetical protein
MVLSLGWGSAVLASYALWELTLWVASLSDFDARERDDDFGVGLQSKDLGGGPQDPLKVVSVPVPSAAPSPERAADSLVPDAPKPPEEHAEVGEQPIAMGAWAGYERTECKGVFVYIVTTFQHSPLDSAASLASSQTGPARLRRVGQSLGEWEVLAITDDWTGLNPSVWLLKDREVCRAELAGNPSRVHVLPKPPPPKRKPRRRRGRKRR